MPKPSGDLTFRNVIIMALKFQPGCGRAPGHGKRAGARAWRTEFLCHIGAAFSCSEMPANLGKTTFNAYILGMSKRAIRGMSRALFSQPSDESTS
jgi:hypothetical protein